MKTTNMNERITFYSVGSGITKDGVPVDAVEIQEFTVWAEVPKLPIREFVNQGNKVGYRKESPVFIIAFKTKKEIQSSWRIKWRNKMYEIKSLDPDYRTRDIIQISTQEVVM
ncbi:phage head closure protein [Latilactobacillus sakei]